MDKDLHRHICRVVGHEFAPDSYICKRCEQLAVDVLLQQTLGEYIGCRNDARTRENIKRHLVSKFTSLICEDKMKNFSIQVETSKAGQIEVTAYIHLPNNPNGLTIKGMIG